MSVTVQDILQSDVLKGATVIAGAGGLNRVVQRVSFQDVPLDVWSDRSCFSDGGLYIQSFYSEREDAERIFQTISVYIRTKSAGCLIYRHFLPSFPQKVIDLANEYNYPLIMLEKIVPYSDLIQAISELTLFSQRVWLTESSLSHLLSHAPGKDEIADTYRRLIPARYKNFLVLYASLENCTPLQFQLLSGDLSRSFSATALRYTGGCFIVLPGTDGGLSPAFLQQFDAVMSYRISDYTLGISTLCTESTFPRGLHQALDACRIAKARQVRRVFYQDRSAYKLLMLLMREHSEELEHFCRDVLSPLSDYGEKNSIDLIGTLSTYIDCNGSIKETALLLHQHENTIRFRVSKARELLNLSQEPYAFIEILSIALQGKNLLEQTL